MSNFWGYPLSALLLAGRFHALGVILHDAIHLNYSHKTWQVYALEILAGYPIASTFNAMRYHHLRHHRYNGTTLDPYFRLAPHTFGQFIFYWSILPLMIPVWFLRAPFGVIAYYFPVLRNTYGRFFLQERSDQDLKNLPELVNCTQADWGQVLYHSGLLLLTIYYPTAMLWNYFIPLIIAGCLSGYRLRMEHMPVPCQGNSFKEIIQTTRTHHIHWFDQLFFAPRHVGYHVVHHLHPQVTWKKLPQLHQWYRQNHPEFT